MKTNAFTKTLYKKHASSVGSWQVEVINNGDGTATMVRTAIKKLGGKPTEQVTHYTEGKNIGRSNETAPLQQAVLEAQSKVRKQLDKGYVESAEQAAVAKVTNSLGFPKPMLAKPIEQVKKWSFPVYASAKLDGHRLLAGIKDGKVLLYSRDGKQVNLVHVEKTLQELYDIGAWAGTVLDGEIYCHGKTLQEISSLVKRPREESSALDYFLYDMMDDGVPYADRLSQVRQISEAAERCKGHNCVIALETVLLDDEDSLNELHSKHLMDGYEGTMVRHGDAGYEDDKRSSSLLKKKDFQDAEFIIHDVTLGTPTIRGDIEYQTPILHMKTECGRDFTATAPGNMHEKDEWWEKRQAIIGKPLTLKFFNRTPDNIPYLPVALRIREDL